MKEEWRSVAGYEGLYEVSSFGRVRSVDREVRNRGGVALKRGRVLSQKVMKSGRKSVNLWKNNTGSMYLVNRLVAVAFLPNPDGLPEVNHKDEVVDNNRVDNLEWCTRKYNANYGTGKFRAAAKMRGRSFNEKPVDQYALDGTFIKRHDSAMKAARDTGVTNSSIGRCANGRYKTAGGFIWKWSNG